MTVCREFAKWVRAIHQVRGQVVRVLLKIQDPTPIFEEDRDGKFTAQFKSILESTLEDAGVKVVPICYQAPNMNAICERWVLSAEFDCINRMILFGEESLRRCIREYCDHSRQERPHQGLGNEWIAPESNDNSRTGEIIETERLGGLLRSYRRVA